MANEAEWEKLAGMLEALERAAAGCDPALAAVEQQLRSLNLEQFAADFRAELVNKHSASADQIAAAVATVSPVIASLGVELREATVTLETVQSAFTAAGEQAAASFAELERAHGELEAAFASAQDTASDAFESLKANMAEAVERFEEIGEELGERVEELNEEIGEKITEVVVEPAREATEQAVGRISALIEEVTQDLLPGKAAEVAEDTVQDLKEKLDAMISDLRSSLDEFRTTMTAGTDSSNTSRSSTDAATQQLQTILDPVVAELDRVKGLANTVGILI